MSIILASASPRREQILRAAGYSCDVRPMDVDERRLMGEAPDVYVQRVAALKADAAVARFPGRIIVGADTAVVVDDEVLGKPVDLADAGRMLRSLSGRDHRVLTGVAVRGLRAPATFVESTVVWVAPLSEAAIAWYVASGEPMDKAGGYGVQGLASRFIGRIEGSYANIVGLPIARLAEVLGDGQAPPGAVTPSGQSPVAGV